MPLDATARPTSVSDWPAECNPPLLDCSIGAALQRVAAEHGDRDALLWLQSGEVRRLTFAELLAAASSAAAQLLRYAEPGQRLAIWAPNCPEWVIAQYAVALAGAVLVPLNPALTDAEAGALLRRSDAMMVLAVEDAHGHPLLRRARRLAEQVPRHPHVMDLASLGETATGEAAAGKAAAGKGILPPGLPHAGAGDDALIQFTSGTTGAPKGAVLSHRAALGSGGLSALAVCQGTRGDGARHNVWLNPLPLHHVGGSVCGVLAALGIGAGYVVMPRFDAGRMLDMIERTRPTHLGGVVTMYLDMLDHPRYPQTDLSSVRTVMAGGSHVPTSLIDRLRREVGAKVIVGYGQSESPSITQSRPDDEPLDISETLGRPLPWRAVRIASPGSNGPLPVGTVGELLTRSPLAMSRYLDDPDGTRAAVDSDGWLHTGDLCAMDERGFVRFAGRLREVVIRGGENIYPAEVEEAVRAHPAVADVAVVGLPDTRLGEIVAAVVRLVPGATVDPDGLAAHVRARLAPFKVPVRWEFVDGFPLTPSGKVQKFVLRDRLASRG